MTDRKEPWHISRAVSVSHILATLCVAAGVILYLADMNTRVTTNRQSIDYIATEQDRASARVETLRAELREDLRSINDKLDRIIENK